MSTFTKIDRFRSRCNICNNEVASKSLERHLEYHTLGDMTLANDEVVCPLCLTPKQADGSNFKNHLKNFHNLSQAEANRINAELKGQISNRQTDMGPKPIASTRKTTLVQALGFEEKKSEGKQEYPPQRDQERARPANFRPFLEGESEIEKERRLNLEYVQKFRAKKRAERGLGPAKQYDRSIIEGETAEERERRKANARLRAWRSRKKAEKEAQNQEENKE